ncbi:MAG TPA: molybdopterin-dependent oxidoreductase [Methylomirabilota bacterium]|nr:molybdopterin-dependent oxidoreductase [Methylomirabilota bacterium]
MTITRRKFLKGSAVAGGAAALTSFLSRDPKTLVAAAEKSGAATAEEWVPTTCWIGKQDCGMLARRINGRVVSLQGHPDHPRNLGKLCPKGVAQIMAVYDPHRVQTPLIRTNEKGKSGTWRKASWDEALTLVGQKIKEVRARDKRLLLWQKGRSKGGAFYDTAFVKASGATGLGHGAYCSDAGYRAAEYTIGPHGVLHPDFRHTKYLLSWGWNVTNAGGNKFCFITWPQQLIPAKERGMKVVVIDPRLRGAGPFADEWVPIRPGTDLALALALSNVLIDRGFLDRDYLKKHTNAPYLVKEDGSFLRVDGKEQVWDPAAGAAKPFDTKGVEPGLEGEYTVGGAKLKTAFQLFKEHVAKSTPEWAASVCGVPADQIRRVALELGQNAMIGSTITLDGVTLPYRPVSCMAYHMAQQEQGFQALRAMIMVFMLLGAVEAVGGIRIDFTWKPYANYEKLDQIKIKDPPYNIYLGDSKYFPINSKLPGIVAKVMQNPAKYGVDYTPEVMILHMANPLGSFASQADFMEAYKKFKFVAAIDPWLSETADYFADVVLPAATIEKYEGPFGASDQYVDAVGLRLPPMKPLFESRGEIDIYMDLCEKAGILYGKGGYLDELNSALKLKDAYKLDLNTKPAVREIFDRWAKSEGIADGVAHFEKNGVKVKGPFSVKSFYGFAQTPPFNGKTHRLYGESLLRYQLEMKAKGAEKIYWQDYTPFPTWRTPTKDGSPPQYDLTLISYKLVEFKQSRSSFIPLLAELAPEQRLEINPKTAKAKGIKDGNMVWVESHNALTGETRKVQVRAALSEGIRPDTVGMPHHYGLWTHPAAKGQGPTPNVLFFTGEGYVTNTADQSFQVKVRVSKA